MLSIPSDALGKILVSIRANMVEIYTKRLPALMIVRSDSMKYNNTNVTLLFIVYLKSTKYIFPSTSESRKLKIAFYDKT